jgi:hypothetical protein
MSFITKHILTSKTSIAVDNDAIAGNPRDIATT